MTTSGATRLGGPQARPTRPVRRSSIGRAAVVLLVIACSVALIRAVVIQSFVIPTGSMEPTLQVGDRVLVARYSYLFSDPSRGDVIVFDGAGSFDPVQAQPSSAVTRAGRAVAGLFGVPVGSKDYVKRVIGIAGDRVVCCDDQGRLTVNGTAIDEPYVAAGNPPSKLRFDVVVPPGRLWVMGDHRSDSADSRSHLGDPGGGTVPVDRVIGRVIVVFWPMSHLGAPSAEGTG